MGTLGNTLGNIGAKVAVVTIAMGLGAGAALAALTGFPVDVTLPEAVNVGNRTLPSGKYQIDQMPLGSTGESMFIFRDHKGNTAAVAEGNQMVTPPAVDPGGASKNTEVLLSPRENGKMHLDELFIQGDSMGYTFR